MPRLLNETELIAAVEKETFIKGGKKENIEGLKYDFTLGNTILKAQYGKSLDLRKLTEIERANIFVEPGEVVFVLTEEVIELPNDIIAFLAFKRKLNHDGIIPLGGTCVDPKYKGKLLIGLYNFSSIRFPIIPGKKLIGAHFYQLGAEEISDYKTVTTQINDFPDDLVSMMTKYHPISTTALSDQLRELTKRFEDFKQDFEKHDNWFEKFQAALDVQEKQVEKILSGLEKEIEERRKSENEMRGHIDDKTKDLSKSRYLSEGAASAVIIIATTMVASIIVAIALKYLFNIGG
ncbi:MAG: hypothetical protein V4615_00740 [Bacteroidota bacterium]